MNEVKKINWKDICLLVIKSILSNFYLICIVLILFYHYSNNGLTAMILPFVLFAFIIPEESRPTVKIWKIAFIYLLFIIILKLFFNIPIIEQSKNYDSAVKDIFLGKNSSIAHEILLIFSILIEINLLKHLGLHEKTLNEYENIYQGFCRKKLLNDFKSEEKEGKESEIDSKKSEEEIKKEEQEINIFSEDFKGEEDIKKNEKSDKSSENIKKNVFFDYQNDLLNDFKNIKPSDFKKAKIRLFSSYARKIGKDYYPILFTVQLIIFIYIFFLYTKMDDSNSSAFDSVQNSSFSGNMVVAIIIHVAFMVFDRLIVIHNANPLKKSKYVIDKKKKKSSKKNKKLRNDNEIKWYSTPIFLKYALLITILIFVNYFTFIFLPTGGTNRFECDYENSNNECSYFKTNFFIYTFYLLYCIYFLISALQIKYGIKDITYRDSLKRGYSSNDYTIYKGYRAIPFLFELRTLMDWTVTPTTLSFTNWLKGEEIHAKLYITKIKARSFHKKERGQRATFSSKFLKGFCLIFFLLIVIFGPMILFSSLNPTAETDLIISANNELNFVINKTNNYLLAHNSKVSELQIVNKTQYSKNFKKNPKFNGVDRKSFQYFQFSSYSDTNWQISYPSERSLLNSINSTLNNSIKNDFSFEFNIKMERNHDEEDPPTKQTINYPISNRSILNKLQKLMTDCDEKGPIELPNFYSYAIQLIQDSNPKSISPRKYTSSIFLNVQCSESRNQTNLYWTLSTDKEGTRGFYYFVVCDQFSSAFLGYSIIGFYVSIVFVVATFIRTVYSGSAESFLFTTNPYPDNLLKICEAIKFARTENDLEKEELLYWYLIDMVRSPEVVKTLTGSLVKELKLKEERRKIEYEKEMKKIEKENENKQDEDEKDLEKN